MTATETRVVLDEHTVAELTPPCELVTQVVCPTHNVLHTQQDCPRPAAWIVRRTCICGDQLTVLACDPHADRKDWTCAVCGATEHTSYEKEALR